MSVQDGRALLLATASEAQFQEAVVALAKRMGWLCFHAHGGKDYRKNEAGFPDLVLVHAQRRLVWFLELKRAGKEPTDDQQTWQAAIRAANWVDASWAQPGDWDAVAAFLEGRPMGSDELLPAPAGEGRG